MSRIVTYSTMAGMDLPTRIVQRLGVDAQGHALKVDGIIGPRTQGGTFIHPYFCEHPLVDVALAELLAGVSERGGNNRGERIREYMADDDLYPGPWCAAFVSWCLRHAYGDGTPYIRGARRLVNALPAVTLREVSVGDVIGWERQGGSYAGHVGIVCDVTPEHIWTVEGNSGPHVRCFRYRIDSPQRSEHGPLWGIGRFSR